MKATVSVYGRFHGFDLARELDRLGALAALVTSYPKAVAARFGVPRTRVRSIESAELLRRMWQRGPAAVRGRFEGAASFLLSEYFDRVAATQLPDADCFVGFSTFSLHSLRRAQERGALTIIERGTAHGLYLQDILRDEYARIGIRGDARTDPRLTAKELAEYEEADAIAVPSLFAKRTFLEQGVPAEKLLQVPYGVDIDQFRPARNEDATFRVLHCGGLTLIKGVHYLLQAFHELRLPDAELWLIGTPTREIQPFLQRYGGEHVRVIRPRPQAQLRSLYVRGSLFCLNSIQDGFGMVLAQAMACGLPVVCTDHTGAPNLVRQGIDGFIIGIRDIPALKEKILFFYENRPLAAEMGAAARQRVCSGFTWRHYGERMMDEYTRLLRGRAGSTSIAAPRLAAAVGA